MIIIASCWNCLFTLLLSIALPICLLLTFCALDGLLHYLLPPCSINAFVLCLKKLDLTFYLYRNYDKIKLIVAEYRIHNLHNQLQRLILKRKKQPFCIYISLYSHVAWNASISRKNQNKGQSMIIFQFRPLGVISSSDIFHPLNVKYHNATHSFVGGFMWLDKLGLSSIYMIWIW